MRAVACSRRAWICVGIAALLVVAAAVTMIPERSAVLRAEATEEEGGACENPSWSPDGTKIVFSSTVDSALAQIWMVNADGTNLHRVGASADQDMNPVWSPDGSLLYFVRYDEAGKGAIWRMGTDGSNAARLGSRSYSEYSCAIDSAGEHLVVSSARGILLYSADGSSQRYIAASGDDDEPHFSPDGTKIVFVRGGKISVRNADQSELAQLTSDEHTYSCPKWSPDGQKIVFASDRDGSMRLWSISPSGTGLQRIFTDSDEPASVSDREPCWSPNGTKVAFTRSDASGTHIWTANTNGTGLTQVTHQSAVPVFAPAEGTYSETQTVSITCPTPGVTIRYTTDGSEPTENSSAYSAPITVDHSLTLKAKAWKTDYFPSYVAEAAYTIE